MESVFKLGKADCEPSTVKETSGPDEFGKFEAHIVEVDSAEITTAADRESEIDLVNCSSGAECLKGDGAQNEI